ncbi:hypothetical protein BXQ17_07920 [Polaribacter sp. BM10]|uniref:hypothetical protein n=1 Tax=Polaribacter sp. BM10 TaxID=1529069 RepID=UPI00098B896A|nr:hypothetical protein [Polaribacter sp. BM10]AQS93992.1 hypothetical protein BXQ17_07920 [Polaribacter sp. BM10]
MINTLEELLQDYARYSYMEGTIDENTSMHLIEDAQNYLKALGKENLLSICGVVSTSKCEHEPRYYDTKYTSCKKCNKVLQIKP